MGLSPLESNTGKDANQKPGQVPRAWHLLGVARFFHVVLGKGSTWVLLGDKMVG